MWTTLALIGLTLCVHVPAVLNAGWVIDDHANLKIHAAHGDLIGEWTTPTYAHAGGASGHIWRPVPATLQHLCALIWDRSPSMFRGLNLFVHLINLALLAWVCRRANPRFAAAVLLIWATHPVLPESICWSSDIYDLMMAMFLLITLTVLPTRPMLALLAFLCALLSKEVALAALPALVMLCVQQRKYVILCGVGATAAAYLGVHQSITSNQYLQSTLESDSLQQLLSWAQNLAWLLYVPAQAPFAHLSSDTSLASLLVAGALGVSFLMWIRYRPEHRSQLLIAALCWGGLLIPVGVGVAISGVHGFRYSYAPLLLVAATIATLPSVSIHRVGWLLIGIWSMTGAWRCTQRIPAWQNDLTLWTAEHQIEPENLYAQINLGRQEFLEGNPNGVLRWASSIDKLDTKRQLLHRHREREALSKAAFLVGNHQLSLAQSLQLIREQEQEQRSIPPDLWCIVADNQERLGHSFEDAESKCSPTQR